MVTNDGHCGTLFEVGNEKSLLSAMLSAAQTDRAAQRDKVLQQFEANLSFSAIASEIYEIAESLLQS